MKLVMILSIVLAFASCDGGSGGGSKGDGNNNNGGRDISDSRVRNSVESVDGKMLTANSWCYVDEYYDEEGDFVYSLNLYTFKTNGAVEYAEIDLTNNSVIESINGRWGIFGQNLVMQGAGQTVDVPFRVSVDVLTFTVDYEDENGSTQYEDLDLTPCEAE